MIDLSSLPRERLEQMSEAGDHVLECYRVLGKGNRNVVAEVLDGQGEFYEWDHYPKGDVYDWETHCQYYYHAHAAGTRGDEHGHFHTFLRPKGMPDGVKPADLPDYQPPPGDNDALSHLVAVSMNPAGFPVRLFTTNRWVTGEIWYPAADVAAMLDRFNMDMAYPSWPVNIWLTAMIRLFRPEIQELLRRRDQAVADQQARKPGANVYEDRDLEVTSVIEVSVEDQIRRVREALTAHAA